MKSTRPVCRPTVCDALGGLRKPIWIGNIKSRFRQGPFTDKSTSRSVDAGDAGAGSKAVTRSRPPTHWGRGLAVGTRSTSVLARS
jgi:hypothetical protein